MGKIGICGDSWMSLSFQEIYKGTHFSELLAKENNLELIHYARQGSSNGAICLQIEQAIIDKCDIILLGNTTYNRIEYTLENYLESTMENFDNFTDLEDITFNDLAEPSHESSIRQNKNFKLGNHTIIHILGNKKHFLYINESYGKIKDIEELELKYQGIKHWFNYMYNPNWKQQVDRYCIYAVLHKLYMSNIPYVFVFDFLGIEQNAWLDKPLFGLPFTDHKYKGPGNKDPGYHTTPEQQKMIYSKVKDILLNKGIQINA